MSKEKKRGECMQTIEKFANQLLSEAAVLRVSDIHIVPQKRNAIIRFRHDGRLFVKETISKETCERLIAHFKFLADMDIGERRRPQNGSMEIEVEMDIIHLRLSTLPTVYNESLVIRLLPQNSFLPLSRLFLFPRMTKKILSLLKHSSGLVIITGPTGSGKTTTLYTLLEVCKTKFNRNIITLEDPIEKRTDDIIQVQINEKANLTFATGLKAILRHDPDVIMIGEIRDVETARIAVRASLTGHLVLTTMHSKDAAGAVYRLMEYDISLWELEQTLLAVSAQRLVDLKCPFCEGKCNPFCYRYRRVRRIGVYELLHGESLANVMQAARGGNVVHRYPTLHDIIKKGVALGFLPSHALEGGVK